MSIIYKYYNGDVELTLQQAQMQDFGYKKYKFINGDLKIIYHIKNGEIIGGDYFLNSNDVVPDLVQEYCTQNGWYFVFYTLLNSAGQYKLWKGDVYNEEGILSSKIQLVIDQDGFDIANAHLDFTTEAVKHGTKRFFNINPDTGKKDALVQFHYERHTFNAESFCGGRGHWDFYYGGAIIEKVYNPEVMALFNYDNHPYFHNLLPLLPANGII
ncbi:hypothetical protein [Nonlabens xiamenensis]|uniref:hypothetical protein n=1 Tax=Nonlabens xiamenensis TaxID=2341043 RepID=UPI000F614254|nr:hypothetical protein [Nonlabens xiamenensis]